MAECAPLHSSEHSTRHDLDGAHGEPGRARGGGGAPRARDRAGGLGLGGVHAEGWRRVCEDPAREAFAAPPSAPRARARLRGREEGGGERGEAGDARRARGCGRDASRDGGRLGRGGERRGAAAGLAAGVHRLARRGVAAAGAAAARAAAQRRLCAADHRRGRARARARSGLSRRAAGDGDAVASVYAGGRRRIRPLGLARPTGRGANRGPLVVRYETRDCAVKRAAAVRHADGARRAGGRIRLQGGTGPSARPDSE
mmetsp:Transcript_1681/g.4562  ORF Transcript_1681/g.4562 Transcript_1681/m.4562 type:complete len:257 (+) Transcript_1681:695-1465(+)